MSWRPLGAMLGVIFHRFLWELFFIAFCGFVKPSWVAKTSQNTSRCLKNQPPKGCMGRPGGPGGPLGWPWPSWGRFGPWGSAGGPPICRLLAPSWRPLGAVLGTFALQNRFLTVKKSVPIWIKILKPSKIDAGSNLGGFWEGKWKHVGT